MGPTGHDIEVATAALHTEAGMWMTQVRAVDGIAATAAGLGFTPVQGGIFFVIVSAHAELAAAVAARCGEGGREMAAIAATLDRAGEVYDEEERRHMHALHNLY